MDGVRGDELLAILAQRGWLIRTSQTDEPLLPADVQTRYPRLPVELTAFLGRLESCSNADETVWFLCREDYRRSDDQAFRWNEFEQMGLEGAHSQPKAQASIRRFWDQHFPFMLAVHSDYDYLAIDLNERSYGRVVHGSGDDFEAPSPVAASFEEFVAIFKDAAENRRDEYPLGHFL